MASDSPSPDVTPKQLPRQFLVRLQNVAHKANHYALSRPIARAIEVLIRLIWTAYLPAEAHIDSSVHFGHNGLGVVINKACQIGPNCFVGTHVVMGGKAPLPGAPKVECNASIHAGAKLIGSISIGEGAVVGANAVVTRDVPAFSMVVGVPATIIKTNINPTEYR